MANEFIIKHGFHSKGNSAITGSLGISGSVDVKIPNVAITLKDIKVKKDESNEYNGKPST